MNYQEQLKNWLLSDEQFKEVFTIINKLHLPNAYICGGVIRDYVWNKKHDLPSSLLFGNIDVFYYDSNESNEQYLIRQTMINQNYSKYLWNLTNTALKDRRETKLKLHKNIESTLKQFPETCSSVAVNYDQAHNLTIIAPYGLEDLFELKIKPTPTFRKGQINYQTYKQRVKRKEWSKKWNKLIILDE